MIGIRRICDRRYPGAVKVRLADPSSLAAEPRMRQRPAMPVVTVDGETVAARDVLRRKMFDMIEAALGRQA